MNDNAKERDKTDPDELFSQAVSFGDQEDYMSGLVCLRSLLKRGIETAAIHMKAGYFLWKQGRLDEAAEHFGRAVQLSPTHEWASVGLFHVLWERGQRDAAFEEMKRFVRAGGKMEEYRQLLDEMKGNDKENSAKGDVHE